MTTMSVTRALAELKRIDDRINRAVMGSTFIGVSVGAGAQTKVFGVSGVSVEQSKSQIQSAYDSVTSLFAQRSAIKAALVKSNATTMVSLGSMTYSVAEAIELKKSVVNQQALLNMLKRQHTKAQAEVSQLNAQLEAAIDSNLKTVYGSDKSKLDKDSYDLIAKPQKAMKEAALIDPMDIVAKIAALEEEISLVATELDFTLSESNARTEIKI